MKGKPVLFFSMMMLPTPLPSPWPVSRVVHHSGQESRSVVYAAGSPIEEVLRFEEDGSIYLRGRFVGKDPAIARIVKQEQEGKK